MSYFLVVSNDEILFVWKFVDLKCLISKIQRWFSPESLGKDLSEDLEELGLLDLSVS